MNEGRACMQANCLQLFNHAFAQELGDEERRSKNRQGHGDVGYV